MGVILEEAPFEKGIIDGDKGGVRQGIYEESATQNFHIGTKLVYGDGRIFRYTKNAANSLTKAKMTQCQVVETKTHEITQSDGTFAIGDRQIAMTITTAGTFVKNEFAQGWFFVNKGTAIGDIYKVLASHLSYETGGARGAGVDDTIMNLLLETPIRTATALTSECSLIPNRWYDVVVFPTAHTGLATGVPLLNITASYYFWAQTGGPCPVIVDTGEVVVIGNDVGSATSTAVAGACGPRVTLEQSWGNVMLVGAAAEPALIWLTLD
jgi:hypothetical protein